mgnify:CR=1 FL=1
MPHLHNVNAGGVFVRAVMGPGMGEVLHLEVMEAEEAHSKIGQQ